MQAVSAVSRTLTQRLWPSGTTIWVLAPGSGTKLTELVVDGELSVLTMLVWFGPQFVVMRFGGGGSPGGVPSGPPPTCATAIAAVAVSVASTAAPVTTTRRRRRNGWI